MTGRDLLYNVMLGEGSKQHLLARLRNPKWIPGREYNARLLRRLPVPPILLLLCNSPEIWMTVAWALSNNRRKVNFCNEEMEVVAPKITDPCAMKEQWSASGNYGVGKQWHHHHKTQNQGTSNKCTKTCINQIRAINPGFISILKLWKIGPNSSTKKGKGKGPKIKFKSLKWYF